MASHRRYKLGKYKRYDHFYGRYKWESFVLNPGKSKPSVHTPNLSDRGGLKAALQEYTGYREAAEKQLEQIEEKFERYKQQQINEGRPKPQRLPGELQEEKFRLLASTDISNEELDEIQKRLDAFANQEEKAQDGNVLKGGPQGSAQIKGGVLVKVDGQKVLPDEDQVLRIRDSRSPYDGLRTDLYFDQVVIPWKRDKARLRNEWDRKVKAGEINPKHTRPGRPKLPPKPEEKDAA